MTRVSDLNSQYLKALAKHPLFTKQVTSGVLAVLNEVIALTATGDIKLVKIGSVTFKHVVSVKLLVMALFGSMVTTPVTHTMYNVINHKIFPGKLSPKQRVLQLLCSLGTVTPVTAALFTAGIAIINQYKFKSVLLGEILRIRTIAGKSLKQNYGRILKTSLVTSFVSIVLAQNFVPTELWVVFFSLIHFLVGTYQNIKLKRAQSATSQKLKEE